MNYSNEVEQEEVPNQDVKTTLIKIRRMTSATCDHGSAGLCFASSVILVSLIKIRWWMFLGDV